MAWETTELNLEEQMMVLDFWAHGMDILLKFSPEKISAVPGLKEAIAAASVLPAAVGWGDEPGDVADANGRSRDM